MRVFAVVLPLACLAACSHGNIDTKEAVRQGVIDYLAGRQNLNVSSMNIEVTSVTFKENEADAVVAFAPKGSGGNPVSIPYTLERKGSRWVVKPHTPGQNPHGVGMPSGESPHGAVPPPNGDTPPGGALPPGHPAVPQK